MPVTKSAKKRLKINKKRKIYNIRYKNKIKVLFKEFKEAITSKQLDRVKKTLPLLMAVLDKAGARGVIHKRKASRKKSQFARMANQLQRFITSSSNANSKENLPDLKSNST